MVLVDFRNIWNKYWLKTLFMLGNWDLLRAILIKNLLLFLQFTDIVENINLLISNLKINWLSGLDEF